MTSSREPPVRPIDPATATPSRFASPNTIQANTETSQNGKVSRSRSGRPFRSHTHRLST